jgi:hypothetical protein
MITQGDYGAVVAEALHQVGGVQDALVFAAAADRNERHFRLHELASV